MAVHTVLVSSGAPVAKPVEADASKQSDPAKGSAALRRPAVVRVASREMVYSDEARTAEFTGGVRVESADGVMRGDRAAAYLQASSVEKAGDKAAAKKADDGAGFLGGSVERVTVNGGIEIDQPGRRATGDKLVRYPGLKEEYYLDGFTPDPGLLARLGVDPRQVVVVVRTAPAYALYLGGSENPLLPRLLERLNAAEGVQTIVLTRTAEQADGLRRLGLDRLVMPPRAVDGRSIVALADVLVSAGGTMNREAAVLGTPVWSMFEGRPGAIDEMLIAQGRLKALHDPGDVVLERKAQRLDGPFAGRDPASLLALAVPEVA